MGNVALCNRNIGVFKKANREIRLNYTPDLC